MKIGIDARLWNETGVGRYIRNLVNNLQRIDTQNEYVLFVRASDYENIKFQISNLKWKLVIADIRWHTIEEQRKFPKILKAENLDLMHFPYFSVPIFYTGKFVITIHDLILHHYPTGKASTKPSPVYALKLLAYKRVLAHAALHAEKIIAVSEATKAEITDHLKVPADKIAVTYEGVEGAITDISGKSLQELESKFTDPYFLYVGNAYPHKNLERLIEAFRMSRKELGSEVLLVLVGKEDYFYKKLQKEIKNWHLESSIKIYYDVDDETLGSFYRHALALIFPSLMEGFGLPAIEAMSQGCLVLASDTPVFHEICQDVALYFDPHHISTIAQALELVYKQRNFSEKKRKGKLLAKKFSWEKMAKETLAVYESR